MDTSLINSFRPIALLSCIRKVLEIIISDKLHHHLQHNNLWPENQYGFKKGGSTLHNLAILVTDIHIAFLKNECIEAIFLDIKRAYDNVDINILMPILQELKIPIKLLYFLKNLLSDRYLSISEQYQEVPHRIANLGLAQGSPLSPLLYNIYTSKLTEQMELGVKVLQYADDVIIYRRIAKLNLKEPTFQNTITRCIEWFRKHNLEINPNKCHYMIFSKRKQNTINQNINISGIRIQPSKTVKFLGLILDEHLRWDKHAEYIISKLGKTKRIFSFLAGRWWGAALPTLLTIYKHLIRPIIDYGSIVISYRMKEKTKLRSILYQILKTITGINGNPDFKALEVETNIIPYELRTKMLANNFLFRIFSNTNNRITPKLQYIYEISKLQNRYYKPYALLESFAPFQRIQHKVLRLPKYPIFMLSWPELMNNKNIYIENIEIKYSQHQDNFNAWKRDSKLAALELLPIFTDGSKQQTGVGAAMHSTPLNIHQGYKLPSGTSIYTAEAFAIRQALIHIKQNNLNNIVILSDSQSVQSVNIDPYESWYITNIKQLFYNLNQNNIYLAWIPGHKNIKGNEQADALAKEAATSGLNFRLLIPTTDYKHYINSEIRLEWQRKWKEHSKLHARYYANIQPSIQRHAWMERNLLPRKITTLFIRLRMGTCRTPEYLYKTRQQNTPDCTCGQFGNINHVLLECPIIADSTNIFYRDLQKLQVTFPINVEFLITQKDAPIIKALHRHVSRCKMKL